MLLPQAIGLRRAKEMSLTGNFLTAEEALHFGLVNHLVPHDQLMATAVGIARDIASNDGAAVEALLASYKRIAATTVGEGLTIEADVDRMAAAPGKVAAEGLGALALARWRPADRSRWPAFHRAVLADGPWPFGELEKRLAA